jgi:hypothetical protein
MNLSYPAYLAVNAEPIHADVAPTSGIAGVDK